MADQAAVDITEIQALAVELTRAAGRVLPEVDAVIKHGAQNIKNEMIEDAKGSPHFKGLARSISYDRDYRLGEVGYVVGPDKDRHGGAIGNIAYFGGVNGGGGTLDIDKPLRNEEPRLLKALGDLGEGLIR